MFRFAVAIFLSAFLLFQIQPLIGRSILPWFGGAPAVWTTCLLFFQFLLLFGYAYAHFSVGCIRPRLQTLVHLGLLTASLACLPILPAETWKPTGQESPTVSILFILGATIGIPYLLLSSTGPLLQSWFSQTHPGCSPYRLYALSNIGSLLALMTYPFFIEPLLTLRAQAYVWSGAYAIFVLLCSWCAITVRPTTSADSTLERARSTSAAPSERPGVRLLIAWLSMAGIASAMLLAITNQMCQEVAVIPFLWIVPLTLYLVSFILCFDSDRWYQRNIYGALLAVLAPASCFFFQQGSAFALWLQVGIYSATLFVVCMICHGELARRRPEPRYLTLYYLTIATGGALGGLFVALLAPLWFLDYWEFYLALAACCLLLVLASKTDQLRARGYPFTWRAWGSPVALLVLLLFTLGMQARRQDSDATFTTRNFYGTLRVVNHLDAIHGTKRVISHGRTDHGAQFLNPAKRSWPTAYYGRESGLALALTKHPGRDVAQGTLRIGIIGLGAGTMAAYGQTGDSIRFYEINPDVTRAAQSQFSFLADSPADIELRAGDGRILLERELKATGSNQFDVLVIDAFSSDAIPMHLLTRESAELYWQHLAPNGILAINISNRHLDLKPVVQGMAEATNHQAIWIRSYTDAAHGTSDADWVLITNNRQFLDLGQVRTKATPWLGTNEAISWTDDFGSLLHVLAR